MFEKSLTFSRARILRIFAFTALFFVTINIAVSLALPSFVDLKRASEQLLSDNVCNFALEDFADINRMITNDKQKKIILLGDSVFFGIGVENESESVSGYLHEMFPDYSVYNLSSCGSKPLDYYFWINRFKEEDVIFVVQYNYKWFAIDNGSLEERVSQKKILTEFDEYMDEEIQKWLGNAVTIGDKASHFLTKNIPVAANRTKLFAAILDEKSKEDFVGHVFFGKPEAQNMAYKQQYWKDKEEMKSYNCKIYYPAQLWDAERNFNFAMYIKTLEFIQGEGLNVVVLMPPYNGTLLKKCMNAGFEENISRFAGKAQEKGIKSVSFAGLVDEKYFLDDMHLNAEGNKQFADLINKEIKQ
ncbi:hypothetical protein C0416_05085 [bacterium]|nr:hypothetical protein [bacterium]